MIWFVILVVSIAVLIYSAEWFISMATRIGNAFRVPQFVIGATVVAIGTSLPELFTNILAAVRGQTEFVLGNVVGSNIANIGFILGLSVLFGSVIVASRRTIKLDIPVLTVTTILLVILGLDRTISFTDAVILLVPFVFILLVQLSQREKEKVKDARFVWWHPLVLLISGAGIYLGSDWTITSVVNIVESFNLADTSIIALTIVAFGTSLPELVSSIAAIRQKNMDMVIGNVIGSNVFNTLLVAGVPALLTPIVISQSVLFVGFPFMIAITALLVIFLSSHQKLVKWEASLLLAFYILYLVMLFLV